MCKCEQHALQTYTHIHTHHTHVHIHSSLQTDCSASPQAGSPPPSGSPHPDCLPICSRQPSLEGALHDAPVPPRGSGRLLWPRRVSLLWGPSHAPPPTPPLRLVLGPGGGRTAVPRLRAPVPPGAGQGRRGRGGASGDREPSAPATFNQQDPVEALAAALLWDLPLLWVP